MQIKITYRINETSKQISFLYLARAAIYRDTWITRNFLDVKSRQHKAILRRKIIKRETTEVSHYCRFTVLMLLSVYLGNLLSTSHGNTYTHTHTHTPAYLRNNRSCKLSNLLTKFFPAGRDRSHFLLRILSEVLNGNPLAWFTCLDLRGRGLFLALETTVQSSGDLSREWGRGSERGPLALTQ